MSSRLVGYGECTPDETAARFGSIEAAHAFVDAVNQAQGQIIVATMSYGTDPVPAEPACIAAHECSINILFNSEGAKASCSCVSALTQFPAPSVEPVARERKSRVRGRPPDSQPENSMITLCR